MDLKIERQKEHFDQIAERYQDARRHPNHLCLKRSIWSHFFRSRPSLPDRRIEVLEPMCGFGDGADILAEHLKAPFDYAGFDYSDEVVRRVRQARPEACIWQQDVSTFTENETYDVVIVLGGLHHVPHVAPQVVASLSRALRPGGYFISLEPTHGNALFRQVRERVYRRNQLFDHGTERAFGVTELFAMFEKVGMRRIRAIYPGLLAYVLYYNPDAFPRLNFGSQSVVRFLWSLEKPFVETPIARALSFATLSLWRKPG